MFFDSEVFFFFLRCIIWNEKFPSVRMKLWSNVEEHHSPWVILFSLFILLQQDTVSNSFPECTPDSITLLIIITNLLIFKNRWERTTGKQRIHWLNKFSKRTWNYYFFERCRYALCSIPVYQIDFFFIKIKWKRAKFLQILVARCILI